MTAVKNMPSPSEEIERKPRVEVDVRRLLGCCESMAHQQPDSNWRLVKYLETLEGLINELQKHPSRPSKDILADYSRRYTFLKGLIQTTQLKNTVQKVVAVQHLPHGTSTMETNTATKEIHQKATAKYNKELKAELFGTDNDDSLRYRNISKPPSSNFNINGNEDLDSILQYHHNMQEKVAENMLLLTRNLKEQSQLASKIIKKDTEVLKTSAELTDTNLVHLSSEHERLKDHNSKACKCWLWLIIASVMMTFISMVLLMKLFKKNV